MEKTIMFNNKKNRAETRITIVELIALLFTLAVLSSVSVFIYNSSGSKAYKNDVILALSTIKIAQDDYFSLHGRYAGDQDFFQVSDEWWMELTGDKLPSLRRLDYEDFYVSLNYPQSDEMLIIWLGDSQDASHRQPRRKAMDHEGHIYIREDGPTESWLPDFPHESKK